MSRLVTALLAIAIVLAVPAILVVNGIRVVADDWYVRLAYDRGGVPRDRYGLTEEQRAQLALVGLHSILPGSEGMGLLREASLPSGEPAFNARELRHMQDVRTLIGRAYRFQLFAVIAIAALAVLLGARRSRRALVPVLLARGAFLTIALALLVGVLSVASYGAFSTPFHSVFFEGESWRFAEADTLRRLYPDRFWLDTAVVLGVLAVAQALALLAGARLWARKAGARQAIRARARTESP